MSGLTAEAAGRLRSSAVGLHHAGAALAWTLEQLCDEDLADVAREDATQQLYTDLADVRLALITFGQAVLGPDESAPNRPISTTSVC
jgi:hypothetical protein